jgi:hypothetical protein
MADLEGVTQAEAARRAGVSVSGMKSRVQRARQQLRTIVEECCRVDLDRRRLDHRVRVTSSRAMRVSRLPIALPITRIDCIRSG